MTEHSRYDVSRKGAGIGPSGILVNKLGIKDQQGLDDAETILLNDAYAHFFDLLVQGKVKFDFPLLISIHGYFLGPLYVWAGKLRTVDISKDGMLFAPVTFLAASIKNFKNVLHVNLPSKKDSLKRAAEKIAIIHDEFNAVHPFREGNGRTIRLFLDLMVARIDFCPVDWAQKGYMRACRRGISQNHTEMAHLIERSFGKGKNKS
jgi:cell filamentation protein